MLVNTIRMIVATCVCLMLVSVSEAAPIFSDNFDGTAGAPPDVTKWTVSLVDDATIKLDGAGEVVITPNAAGTNATTTLNSIPAFSPGIVATIDFTRVGTGNGQISLHDAGWSRYIMLSLSGNNIIAKGPGGTDSTTAGGIQYHSYEDFIAEITWTTDLVKVKIDGNEVYSTTNPAYIPTTDMSLAFGKQRNSNPTSATLRINSVVVSEVPEPASMIMAGLGLVLSCSTRRVR